MRHTTCNRSPTHSHPRPDRCVGRRLRGTCAPPPSGFDFLSAALPPSFTSFFCPPHLDVFFRGLFASAPSPPFPVPLFFFSNSLSYHTTLPASRILTPPSPISCNQHVTALPVPTAPQPIPPSLPLFPSVPFLFFFFMFFRRLDTVDKDLPLRCHLTPCSGTRYHLNPLFLSSACFHFMDAGRRQDYILPGRGASAEMTAANVSHSISQNKRDELDPYIP